MKAKKIKKQSNETIKELSSQLFRFLKKSRNHEKRAFCYNYARLNYKYKYLLRLVNDITIRIDKVNELIPKYRNIDCPSNKEIKLKILWFLYKLSEYLYRDKKIGALTQIKEILKEEKFY